MSDPTKPDHISLGDLLASLDFPQAHMRYGWGVDDLEDNRAALDSTFREAIDALAADEHEVLVIRHPK